MLAGVDLAFVEVQDVGDSTFVNPVISARQGEQVYQEGCLSVPGIYADVTRSDVITVDALDRHGDVSHALGKHQRQLLVPIIPDASAIACRSGNRSRLRRNERVHFFRK